MRLRIPAPGRGRGTGGSATATLEATAPLPPGVVARVAPSGGAAADPLEATLALLGTSVGYDAGTAFGVGGWTDAVVELEADAGITASVGLPGRGLAPWRVPRHSAGLAAQLRVCLDEVDPGTGFDVWVRRDAVLLCRWPTRAVALRGVWASDQRAAVPDPTAQVGEEQVERRDAHGPRQPPAH